MTKRQIAQVLRLRAADPDTLRFTCWVVDGNGLSDRKYAQIFSPLNTGPSFTLSEDPDFDTEQQSDKTACHEWRQSWRATALCLLADMLESGDF